MRYAGRLGFEEAGAIEAERAGSGELAGEHFLVDVVVFQSTGFGIAAPEGVVVEVEPDVADLSTAPHGIVVFPDGGDGAGQYLHGHVAVGKCQCCYHYPGAPLGLGRVVDCGGIFMTYGDVAAVLGIDIIHQQHEERAMHRTVYQPIVGYEVVYHLMDDDIFYLVGGECEASADADLEVVVFYTAVGMVTLFEGA